MRHIPLRAAWLSVVVLTAAPLAQAGTVLLSRESDLRASGASASGEYELSNGTADLEAFADSLVSDIGPDATSSAEQHSSPRFGAGGALAGASADGAARAAVATDIIDAFSDAQTDFDLFFSVSDKPALFTLDATLAAGGDATAGVLLRRPRATGDEPVLAIDVSEETRAVRESAVLAPGTYGLSVWAFARGTPAESTASYAVSVALLDAEPGVTPIPLPAAVWAGAAGLSVVAVMSIRSRTKPVDSRN